MSISVRQEITKSVSTFFPKDVIKVIQEYDVWGFVESLAERIIKNVHEPSNELVVFILKNIEGIPDLASCKLRNVDETRKVCLFIYEHREPFLNKERIFGEINVIQVATYCLFRIPPTNEVDSITLEPIAKKDIFRISVGQQFSIKALIDYHNTRPYRESIGEEEGQKFILNPLTNSVFPPHETMEFINTVCRVYPDKGLIDLHSSDWGSPVHSSFKFCCGNSLKDWYKHCKSIHARR